MALTFCAPHDSGLKHVMVKEKNRQGHIGRLVYSLVSSISGHAGCLDGRDWRSEAGRRMANRRDALLSSMTGILFQFCFSSRIAGWVAPKQKAC